MALRRRQAKNFCCLLLLANGMPMFCAGDEFLHTQRGNNNPYNQDNEITWLDWARLDAYRDVHRFFRRMIALPQGPPDARPQPVLARATCAGTAWGRARTSRATPTRSPSASTATCGAATRR